MIYGKLKRPDRGVTLTEMLVVLLIISLLSTIALPVYINKAEEAKVTVARHECRNLAQAEETVAMYTGFYVPLQVLDDLPGDQSGSITTYDTIEQETSGVFLIDQSDPVEQLDQVQIPITNTTERRVVQLRERWRGPFIEFHRYFKDTNDPDTPGAWERRDFPLDPWNNPYLFYTPIGLVGSTVDPENTSFMNGQINRTYDRQDLYDRYAIVSMGPDGLPDYGFGIGDAANFDDIVHLFGSIQRETFYQP